MLLDGNGDARADVPNEDDADDEAAYQSSNREGASSPSPSSSS